MEDPINFIEPLFERTEQYGKVSCQLLKLKAVDKAAGMASLFVSKGAVILFFCMFTLIANIGVALWLGELFGKLYFGFFCLALFYMCVGGIVHFFMHDWIKKRVSNSIITQLLN